MVFSSATFLFLFLPITVAAYYLIGGLLADNNYRVKNEILLFASLVFYAWGEPVYIVLMLLSILFNFIAGKDMANSRKEGRNKRVKTLFVFSLIFNIGVLGFFKYADFAIENIQQLLGLRLKPLNLPLPIGISFYTFQVMSYMIDLYKGKIRAQRKLLNFALYISLFPQLIAGPIVKYRDIQGQLWKRNESVNKFGRGLSRFLVGMAKKLMLANTLGAAFSTVQEVDSSELGALSAWVGIICYTLQIYFDFSGYSDMAIGLGKMFGFDFNENFNYPYIALSATDFWRRWHISLSSWFKDYVYIPLGGNRKSTPRVIFNLLVVWLLTGLWHGAAWNFVLWGLYYGIVLILEKYLLSKYLERLPKLIRWLLTALCVIAGWVLFSAPTLSDALIYYKAMLGFGAGIADSTGKYLLVSNISIMFIGVVCCLPMFKRWTSQFSPRTISRLQMLAYPLLLIICIIFMISETYNPFLYFRF